MKCSLITFIMLTSLFFSYNYSQKILIEDKSVFLKNGDEQKLIKQFSLPVKEAIWSPASNRIAVTVPCKLSQSGESVIVGQAEIMCSEKNSLYIIDLAGFIILKACYPKADNALEIEDFRWFDNENIGYFVKIRPELFIAERINILKKGDIDFFNGCDYKWSENFKFLAYKVWIPSQAPEEYQNDFLKINYNMIYPATLDFTVKHDFITPFYWIEDKLLYFIDKSLEKKRLVYYSTGKSRYSFITLDNQAMALEYDGKKYINILSENKSIIKQVYAKDLF